ncbi:hypothetical protein [Aquimarina litoralis]|uniref:Uncharacterized protein n=1 Tax=Aquimarina litoralis TaxID=584605 RepID=A0ABP3U4R4_9FLAO|nr:hypothetical protein [uncultured Aquimarina sp.]
MKRLFLPLALISFAVICLSIVHIDNVNKLDKKYNQLRQKHQLDTNDNTEVTAIEQLDKK